MVPGDGKVAMEPAAARYGTSSLASRSGNGKITKSPKTGRVPRFSDSMNPMDMAVSRVESREAPLGVTECNEGVFLHLSAVDEISTCHSEPAAARSVRRLGS